MYFFLNRFKNIVVLIVFFLSLFGGSYGSESFVPYRYLVTSQQGGPSVRITTTAQLDAEENKVLDELPQLSNKGFNTGKSHYLIVPGRADHAEKYFPFIQKFLEEKRDAHVWCIDPYGQGGSGGSIKCEGYDQDSLKPCCMRRGHGTWQDYANVYVSAVSAIHKCLTGDNTSKPSLTLIAHSMSANVDMWARLVEEYERIHSYNSLRSTDG